MRLTKDIERPELTERKYKAINTCYYNSPAACADKLGEYENIDESPKHLAKVKQAFDVIKEKRVNVSLLLNTKDYYDYNDHVCRAQIYLHSYSKCLTQEEWNFLREVLL